jgi:hypothetical protein
MQTAGLVGSDRRRAYQFVDLRRADLVGDPYRQDSRRLDRTPRHLRSRYRDERFALPRRQGVAVGSLLRILMKQV